MAAFVDFLERRYGGRAEAMARQEPMELRRQLLEVPGIGPETADCMALYAAGHPLFVVDAYTRRVFSRLGLIQRSDWRCSRPIAIGGFLASGQPRGPRSSRSRHLFPKEPQRGPCLAELDRLPIVFSRKCVKISASQKANVVGVLKLIDVGRVASELLVEPANGERVLLTPAHEFVFLGSLQGGGRVWGSRSKPDDQQGQGKQNRQQDVPALLLMIAVNAVTPSAGQGIFTATTTTLTITDPVTLHPVTQVTRTSRPMPGLWS